MNAVLVSALAGGDTCPEHGRKHGIERGHIAHHTGFHELLEVRHLARIHERGDDLPIGGVPAYEENFAGGRH